MFILPESDNYVLFSKIIPSLLSLLLMMLIGKMPCYMLHIGYKCNLLSLRIHEQHFDGMLIACGGHRGQIHLRMYSEKLSKILKYSHF